MPPRPRQPSKPPWPSPLPRIPGHWTAVFRGIARQAAFQVLRLLPGAPPDYKLRKMVARLPWKMLRRDVRQARHPWPQYVDQADWPIPRSDKEESHAQIEPFP